MASNISGLSAYRLVWQAWPCNKKARLCYEAGFCFSLCYVRDYRIPASSFLVRFVVRFIVVFMQTIAGLIITPVRLFQYIQ